MDIKSFESLARTENTAKRFLTSLCWKNYRRFCIRCNSYQIYRIAGKRFRCKRCKYTFHDFTGRWIHKLRISCKDWLWVIKFFELELSARKIAQQMDLSYPTVLKAVTLIRKVLPTAAMPVSFSAVKSNWMKPISVVDEKATVARSTKSRYSAS